MTILSRKQKIYLGLGGCAALLALVSFFIIKPNLDKISSLKVDIQNEHKQLDALANEDASIKKYVKDETKLNENLKKLETALVTEENALYFILATENIAKKLNLKQTINIENDENPSSSAADKNKEAAKVEDKLKDIPTIDGQIAIEGKFKDILTYIMYFEKIIPMGEISIVQITYGGPTQIKSNVTGQQSSPDTNNTLQVLLNIRIFTQ